MKAYTDIEQSQKLAEILPLESADMHWSRDFDGSWFVDLAKYTSVKMPKYVDKVEEYLLPCWSLAALVELLPSFIRQSKFGRDTSYWLHMTKRTIRYEYYDESYDGYDYLLRATDDNYCLLDAVYSAIVKLKERKLL